MIAEHGDRNLKELVGVTVIAEQRRNLAGWHGRVGHKAVGKKLDRFARRDTAQNLALFAINLGQVIDKFTMFDASLRVRRNKGKFVRRFARAFDGADTVGLLHSF